jgi:hypothetical protein
MTDTRLWELDDGSTWWFAAVDQRACRAQWIAACIDSHGYRVEADILADLGEPSIRIVLIDRARKILIVDDEHMAPCPHCGTPDKVHAKRSLLDVWREDNNLPPERRAKHGALANSEWP